MVEELDGGFKKFQDKNYTGYYYTNIRSIPNHKVLCIIHSINFSRFRDSWWALNLELKREDGLYTHWSFPLETQIGEFLNLMKALTIESLLGRPIFALYHSEEDSCIEGIAINLNLVRK